MGNSANASSKQEDSKRVMEAMSVLSNQSTSQAERRAHFDWLRGHLAPDTSRSQAYSDELSRVFALRLPKWPEPAGTSSWSPTQKRRLADSIRGCLFGAALGDAAGLATEFLDKSTIVSHYGSGYSYAPGCKVFADSHRISFPSGDWTDDTDQQLLLLQSLLSTSGIADPCDFARRLAKWKDEGFSGLGDQGGAGLGATTKAIINRSGFLDNPKQAAIAVWESRQRQVAPNGAVMRTAIAGVPSFWDLDVVERNTVDLCQTTHADPRCVASCVLVTSLVAFHLQSLADEACADGTSVACAQHQETVLQRALDRALEYVDAAEAKEEIRQHAECDTLEALELDDKKAIGYTLKCLGAGCWAWQKAPELGFQAAVGAVIEEGGDADTNATVAGALVGCCLGYSGLPRAWLDGMPYGHWLEAWVQKLLFMLGLPVVSESHAEQS